MPHRKRNNTNTNNKKRRNRNNNRKKKIKRARRRCRLLQPPGVTLNKRVAISHGQDGNEYGNHACDAVLPAAPTTLGTIPSRSSPTGMDVIVLANGIGSTVSPMEKGDDNESLTSENPIFDNVVYRNEVCAHVTTASYHIPLPFRMNHMCGPNTFAATSTRPVSPVLPYRIAFGATTPSSSPFLPHASAFYPSVVMPAAQPNLFSPTTDATAFANQFGKSVGSNSAESLMPTAVGTLCPSSAHEPPSTFTHTSYPSAAMPPARAATGRMPNRSSPIGMDVIVCSNGVGISTASVPSMPRLPILEKSSDFDVTVGPKGAVRANSIAAKFNPLSFGMTILCSPSASEVGSVVEEQVSPERHVGFTYWAFTYF